MSRNLAVTLLSIGLLTGSAAMAASGDEFVIQKGQVSCTTESDLDAFQAKVATDAAAVPDGNCRAFDAPVKVEVVTQKTANRVYVRILNGQNSGTRAWMNR